MALNTNDPLYAYNTPGFTNQNDGVSGSLTANIPTAGATGIGADITLVEPAALSGFITRTLDPDLSTSGGTTATMVTTTGYTAQLEVLGPAVTKKVCFTPTTNTLTQTHAWVALCNSAGVVVAATADQGSTGWTSATFDQISWSATTLLSPGVYYLLFAAVFSAGTIKFSGIASPAAEMQGLLSGASLRFATTVATFAGGPPALGATAFVTTTLTSAGALTLFAGLT